MKLTSNEAAIIELLLYRYELNKEKIQQRQQYVNNKERR